MSNFIRKIKTPENFVPWTESEFRRHMFWDSLKYKFPFCQIKNSYYFLRDWFSPRQKWLTKDIPNHWSDKTALIPQLLIKCLIHFVEEEKCFANTDYAIYDEDGKDTGQLQPFAEELILHYKIAKQTLPELFKAKEDKCSKWIEEQNLELREKMWIEYEDLEKECEDLETTLLVWIVKNRDRLWT